MEVRRLHMVDPPGVTEPDDVLLGRAEIERAFAALGERLVRQASSQTYSSSAAPPWLWLTMLRA